MSNTLITKLYPSVEKTLSVKSNEDKMFKIIGGFVDRNMEKLSKPGPVDRVPFETRDKDGFVEVVGLDNMVIKEAIKESKYINNSWQVMQTPFYTASALAIRYYAIKNKKDNAHLVSGYLCLGMYPLIHWKYFRHGTNENVMNYTIANLSNKYKFKTLGSTYAALMDMAASCYDLHVDRIKKGGDKEITDFINDMHSRLNDRIKNVSNEFYKNYKEGKYLNVDSDNIDEDNYHEADNNSFAVDRILNNVVTKLIVQGPNMKLVNMSAKIAGVSVNELRNHTNNLANEEHKDEIRELCESILHIYLFENQKKPEDIKSHQFLLDCLEVYKRSNSNDKNVNKIKAILDQWIDDLDVYKKTQRVATINNFRRAIYIFFVLSIQYYV